MGENSKNQTFLEENNVKIEISYPKADSCQGAVISFVEFIIYQVFPCLQDVFHENDGNYSFLFVYFLKSNFLSRIYVIGGGVGQRKIQFVIEAQKIFYYEYSSKIYGGLFY